MIAQIMASKRTLSDTKIGAVCVNMLCEVGGCSSEICAVDASGISSVCWYLCEFSCLQYQTCGINAQGTCEWKTNSVQELDYENCINACTASSTTVDDKDPDTPSGIQPIHAFNIYNLAIVFLRMLLVII
eukprot:598336_1